MSLVFNYKNRMIISLNRVVLFDASKKCLHTVEPQEMLVCPYYNKCYKKKGHMRLGEGQQSW